MYAEIGRRIRSAREAAGLTQYELADLLGVTRPSVQMMERGSQRIHLHVVIAVAGILNVRPSSLIKLRP